MPFSVSERKPALTFIAMMAIDRAPAEFNLALEPPDQESAPVPFAKSA